jgi:hypothetical protein
VQDAQDIGRNDKAIQEEERQGGDAREEGDKMH